MNMPEFHVVVTLCLQGKPKRAPITLVCLTLAQRWLNAGPTPAALAQHLINAGPTFRSPTDYHVETVWYRVVFMDAHSLVFKGSLGPTKVTRAPNEGAMCIIPLTARGLSFYQR